ncbi:MAG: ribonuclease E/G, partial [Comamonas sp.]|jgi:ribonuclease E|nr:ribonuclease E/G [Comamonas sp.]
VIDFIDMEESKNRREVENRLRDALRQDRARVQFGTISKFGLMEMSRQRLKPALSEGAHINCPRCGGSGHIRDTESSALQILRIIQEESMKDNTAAVHCQVPVEVASFLLNEKRSEITKIELKQRVNVIMVPNKSMDTPHYKLERLKHDDARLESMEASYKLADEPEEVTTVTRRSQEPTNKQTPVIKGVLPDAPAPIAEPRAPRQPRPQAGTPAAAPAAAARPVVREQGFFAWLKNLFGFGTPTPVAAPAPAAETPTPAAREGSRDARRSEGRGDRNRRGGERGDRNERNGGEQRAERGGDRNNRRNGANRDSEQQRNDRPEQQQRQERGNRRERSNERRDDRQPQVTETALNANEEFNAQAAPKQERNRSERGERGDRGDRNEGGNRRERQPRNADAQTVMQPVADENLQQTAQVESTDQAQEAQGEQQPREQRQRRSRDRYGRDRRDRAPRDAQAVEEQLPEQTAEAQAPVEAPAAEASEQPARRSYFDSVAPQAQAEQAPAATEVQAPAAPLVEAAVQATPVSTDVAAPVAAIAAEPQQAAVVAEAVATPAVPETMSEQPAAKVMSKVQAYELPTTQLQELASACGLQWINSDADKVAAVQAAIAAEPKPVRIPRERPPAVVLDEGPLVLVETRKDLSLMQLPFEKEEQTAGQNA